MSVVEGEKTSRQCPLWPMRFEEKNQAMAFEPLSPWFFRFAAGRLGRLLWLRPS
jgi:hypothetical protein